jgi:hypothetical protein
MEYEKLYKDPELNLNQVASLLDVHPNILHKQSILLKTKFLRLYKPTSD